MKVMLSKQPCNLAEAAWEWVVSRSIKWTYKDHQDVRAQQRVLWRRMSNFSLVKLETAPLQLLHQEKNRKKVFV